jgi:RND family efflux transporter MFP subunit
VKVETVSTVERTACEEAPGEVRARTVASVSALVMGRITAIPVSEGSSVRKGDLLVAVDDAQPRSRLAEAEGAVAEALAAREEAERAVSQAEASRTLAAKSFDRYRKLMEARVVTPQEFDEVETRRVLAEKEYERVVERRAQVSARISQARAREAEARTALGWCRVTAPFPGVVTEKRAEPGTMAVPGVPLLVLEDPSMYRMEASVSESFLPHLKKGSAVTVLLDAEGGRERTGVVSEVVPRVESASRTYVVKADLPSAAGRRGSRGKVADGAVPLRGGMSGRLRFSAGGVRRVLSVPESALVRTGGYDALYAVTPEGFARLVMVKTGAASDGRREILSGLEEGAVVAVSSVDRLADGARVEVAK